MKKKFICITPDCGDKPCILTVHVEEAIDDVGIPYECPYGGKQIWEEYDNKKYN